MTTFKSYILSLQSSSEVVLVIMQRFESLLDHKVAFGTTVTRVSSSQCKGMLATASLDECIGVLASFQCIHLQVSQLKFK